MFCPRCGQQQVCDTTKFCSKCGMQLTVVSEVLANHGFLPKISVLAGSKSALFTRKNGVIFTVLWFIVFVMMLPAFFGLGGVGEAAGASAIFGVFTTMMFVIASLAFLPRGTAAELPSADRTAGELYGPRQTAFAALPFAQTKSAADYVKPAAAAPDTGDLLPRPASVTEGTTKLLKNDKTRYQTYE